MYNKFIVRNDVGEEVVVARDYFAMDVFSLGCVFYFVLVPGTSGYCDAYPCIVDISPSSFANTIIFCL